MNYGPFIEALESDNEGVVRKELTTFRIKNDQMIKEVAVRVYCKDGSHQDSVTYDPLVGK